MMPHHAWTFEIGAFNLNLELRMRHLVPAAPDRKWSGHLGSGAVFGR
jgi:hypothetical protein